ncbi:MAG: RluA family pseudouridine synthase [Polyangiales bacterium]
MRDATTLVVPGADAGARLDRWLADHWPEVSRAEVQRWIEDGHVRGETGQPLHAKVRVKAGMKLWVEPQSPPALKAHAEAMPLSILYEDAALIVVDKPAGLVVHPAPGHTSGTLVNGLLHHTGSLAATDDPLRPGIVHRLDKNTSGVLVVAKTLAVHRHLAAQFAAHSIERHYLALVLGKPPAKLHFDTLHGRHPRDRKRFSGRVRAGKRAVTDVEVLQYWHGAAWVRCQLQTGRSHQIRVHLSEAGYPLLGDAVYGRTPRDPQLRLWHQQLGRQALHAASLAFVHPLREERMCLSSNIHEDLQQIYNQLTQAKQR